MSQRTYELVYIVPPSLAEDEINTVQDNIETWIGNGDGNIVKVSPWGRRRLAYLIEAHKEGYYTLVEFTIDPTQVSELERRLRLDANVIRHLVVHVEPEKKSESDQG